MRVHLTPHRTCSMIFDNGDGTASVALTHGLFARIDIDDKPTVEGVKWSVSESKGVGYAQGWVNGRVVGMHRLIVSAPQGTRVDHINKDTLDNRRSNLRICTNSQNMANRVGPPSNNATGYLGVRLTKNGKRFVAFIGHMNTTKYIGTFDTPEEAARARDRTAKGIFGEFAYLNFPESNSV